MTVEPIVSTLVDEEACRGCGLCVALCPYGALEIVRGEKGRKVQGDSGRLQGMRGLRRHLLPACAEVNSYTDDQIGEQIRAFLNA